MKNVLEKRRVYKFLFRWMVVNVVFLLIKVSVEHDRKEIDSFLDPTTLFYYLTTFMFFMVTWEFNDWLIKRERKRAKLNFKNSLKIFAQTMALLLPLSAIVYFLALFPLREAIGIVCEDPFLEFRSDFFRVALIGSTVVFINLFYFTMKQKEEMEEQMENLKREMLASKYSSLKTQISPHFLFNSLNTLTSLMYEDRDLASDFVTRLASSYRYILENNEDDLVSLRKELNFLDAFVFMMEVRHKNAVFIKTDIKVSAENYWIPTLTLQMLIENALKHNLYSKEKPLYISIGSIEKSALAIKNNLRKRTLKYETTKLGLENIRKRYSYYTNKQVLVREEDDVFEVIVPLLDKNIKETNILAIS
ncbi:histidine kinase [Flagellimonas sp. HMM57]|uniref:sensor histidine kinase n=1 Tax=unclassified Flagellimonas TaxID=2644544 RepID=UPI0013D1A755|nr:MULTISPECIES: histidine kinase [unclassified Flagellimonas]UII74520.1 histidine kinase [Flagellimonas sp. HMM57]